MTVSVAQTSRAAISELISCDPGCSFSQDERKVFNHCLSLTTTLWVGKLDDRLVCTWGIIPPTLMSEQVYLWLYVTEAIAGNEFLFVRHSQLAVAEILKEYPTITGYTDVDNKKAIRWLGWLGATFGPSNGKQLPFVIRKK